MWSVSRELALNLRAARLLRREEPATCAANDNFCVKFYLGVIRFPCSRDCACVLRRKCCHPASFPTPLYFFLLVMQPPCKDQTLKELIRNRLQLFYQWLQSRPAWKEPEGSVRIGGSLWPRPLWRLKTSTIGGGHLPLPPWFERTLALVIDSHLYTWVACLSCH